MPAKKSSSTKKPNPESPETTIQVIKEARCKSLEGTAHLTYQIGRDGVGEICFRVLSNSGGGFHSQEWVEYWAIERAIFDDWPKDKPITSMALRGMFQGKSVNTPSFLMAVLRDVGFLEPVPGKKRVHQACDPLPVLANLEKGSGTSRKKPARKIPAKAKAKPKVKAKSAPRKKAPAKSPRKRSPASKKKA